MTDLSTVKLHFKQYSDAGPPLVVLHGLFGSHNNWGWHNKQLASEFAVYGVDLRNHGESPHADELNYHCMAADVSEFMARQRLTHCAMIGHSMGGKVAMQLALNEPDLVARLIVVDIAPVTYCGTADGHLRMIADLRSLDLSQLTTRTEAERQLANMIEDDGTRQFMLTNLVRNEQGDFRWRLNLDAIAANYDVLRQAPMGGTAFSRPTLFVKGALSNYIRARHEADIKQLFPDAEVKIIVGAGHWVHAEKPQALQKIMRDFLIRGTP